MDQAVSAVDAAGSRMYLHGPRLESGGAPDGTDETFVIDFGLTPPRARRIGTIGPPPSPRSAAVLVFDPRRNRLLLIGGRSATTTFDATEVWQLELGDPPRWSRLEPLGQAPSSRSHAAAALDPVGDRVVVHGGGGSSPLDETWALELSPAPRWSRLATAGVSPPPAIGASFVHDTRRDRLVMLGGGSGTELSTGNAWTLTLRGTPTWSLLPIPPPKLDSVIGITEAAYDSSGDRILAFVSESGRPETEPLRLHALHLDAGGHWETVTGSGAIPATRWQPSLGLLPAQNRLVLFAGSVSGSRFTSDLFGLDLATGVWTDLEPIGALPRSSLTATGAFDESRRRAIVLAGTPVPETWILDLDPVPVWHRPVTSTPVPAVGGMPAVHDPGRRRFLVYDGLGRRMWIVDPEPGTSWTQLATANEGPGSRTMFSFVADPDRDRVLVFGGLSQTVQSDLWELSFAADPPRWTELWPGGVSGPPARSDAWMLRDPIGERLVLTGGRGTSLFPPVAPGVWTWPLASDSAWSFHAVRGEAPVYTPRAAFERDPFSDSFLLAGFHSDGRKLLWSLDLAGDAIWTPLPTRDESTPGQSLKLPGFLDRVTEQFVFPMPSPVEGFSLVVGRPAPALRCPANATATRGSIRSVTLAVDDATGTNRTFDYVLTSGRPWPGFPIAGRLEAPGSISSFAPVLIAVPDSAALGTAGFALSLRDRGSSTEVASCGFALTIDGIPPPPPTDSGLAFAADQANPIRGSGTLRFDVPAAGEVRLEGFDVTGRPHFRVRHTASEAGRQVVDLAAVAGPSGLYFIRLTQNERTVERRIVLLR